MDNYQHLISLGYVCNVSSMLHGLKRGRKKPKTNVFDHIGIPMWAVSELVDNNFNDFLNPANVETLSLFDESPEEYILDKLYNARLPIKNIEARLPRLKNIMERKIVEFDVKLKAAAANDERILFIRYEEPMEYSNRGHRIIFPEYTDKYALSERFYLEKFSTTIKTKYPTLQFKILFMNQSENNFVDSDINVVGITAAFCDYKDRHVISKMGDILKSHKQFLEEHLK